MNKATLTMRIDYKLSERLRNAVYWTPGATISDFLQEAITDLLEKKEEQNGGPFEHRNRLRQNKRHIK